MEFDAHEHALNDVWLLNLSTLQWNEHAYKLPKPLYFHVMSWNEDTGCVYIFGGVYRTVRQNTLYVSQMFWKNLAERCFEKVVGMLVQANGKNLGSLKKEDLCEIGLPQKFVKRLQPHV